MAQQCPVCTLGDADGCVRCGYNLKSLSFRQVPLGICEVGKDGRPGPEKRLQPPNGLLQLNAGLRQKGLDTRGRLQLNIGHVGFLDGKGWCLFVTEQLSEIPVSIGNSGVTKGRVHYLLLEDTKLSFDDLTLVVRLIET